MSVRLILQLSCAIFTSIFNSTDCLLILSYCVWIRSSTKHAASPPAMANQDLMPLRPGASATRTSSST
jgi:hypothetical protein